MKNDVVESLASLDDVVLSEELPPLVLIAFVRPDLLKEVLKAIRQQTLLPQKIVAFIDGARKIEDEPLIEQCISLLEEFSELVPVQIVARTHNLGGERNENVLLGLTEVLSSSDSLVYLEDDTVPNPYFYDRMCRLLEVYRESKQVCSVSAYSSLPRNLYKQIDTDFIVSNRVFCWGFGTWADRWQEMDIVNQSGQYNPFGSFDKIPATSQTKMTIVNQFWLEKNKKTDWLITFTLAALYSQKVHIVPRKSFTYNIGFDNSQSRHYKGKEETWVNTRYDANFQPNSLPNSLELPHQLKNLPNNLELVQHLFAQKSLWLNPSAFLYLLKNAQGLRNTSLLLKLFLTRLPIMLKRWYRGLPI